MNSQATYYAFVSNSYYGIYTTWSKAKANIHGLPGVQFKKFTSLDSAKEFIAVRLADFEKGVVKLDKMLLNISYVRPLG